MVGAMDFPSEFVLQSRVAFHETDLAGIVHFSRFFLYMEEAEHAFWRARGLSIAPNAGPERVYGWPRVSAACDYLAPLRFEDEFEVRVIVLERRTRSIRYGFLLTRLADKVLCARGTLTAVCVQSDGAGGMRAVEFPASVETAFCAAAPERIRELGWTP